MNYSIVVMFHEIHSSVWFNEVLVHLGKKYKFVNADQLYENIHSTGLCHITFDDGHRSFFENAYPVLYELQIPATLFVSPKVIEEETNYWFQSVRKLNNNDFHQYVCKKVSYRFSNPITDFSVYSILKSIPVKIILELIENYESENRIEEEPYMNITKEQLIELNNSGLVEIGSHTNNHPILANESGNVLEWEIKNSIERLEKLIGKDIGYFAYPNGQPVLDFGDRELKILKETTIKLAFSTDSRKIKGETNNYMVPRIGISKGNNFFIDNKIRFAEQWIQLRNAIHRNTEDKERKYLKAMSLLDT
jgi:peptidoglycan/xylan/chitin deacetylase (PgdA/CDA1 family)